MKQLLVYIFCAVFASSFLQAQIDRTKAPEPGPAPKIQIGKAESFALDNGLKVFLVENHKLPRVSFSLTLDRDPLTEGDKVGYISMAGDLMSRGTTTRSKDDIDAEVDFIGANLSTFSTGAFGTSLKKHMPTMLELMTDVLFNPTFPEEELEKIKTEALSGIKGSKENPGAIAGNVRSAVLYGMDHPYGEVQREEFIENISVEDCKAYYNTYFRPNIGYLVIVGDIDMAEAKPLVEKYFGSWEKGTVPEFEYETPSKPASRKVAIGDKSAAVQTVLSVAYPVELKLGDEDYIAARVMNSILGGSFGSRLMQNLRETHGYTYGSRSSLSQDRLVGSFQAGASVRNEVTDSAVYEILFELDKIANNPVEAEELEKAKAILTGSFSRSLESPQTVARFALNQNLYNLPDDYYETYLEKLNALTLEDIQKVAQKYITPENAYVVAVGDAKLLEEKLASFGEITKYDYYGDVMKDADPSLSEGISAKDVVEKYLNAVGGADKLAGVTATKMIMALEVQGQTIEMITTRKDPNKFLLVQKLPPAMGGAEMKQVFDGEKGLMTSPMGNQPFPEDQIKEMKYASSTFMELNYEEKGLSAEFNGVKNLDGQQVYELTFSSKDGFSAVRSYSIETGFLLKNVQGGQSAEYQNYAEASGIMFPHTILVSTPMGKFPANVSSIEVNPEIDDTIFAVE
ncbi:MAG: pitrilysin family protein [Bacteroidota bacterium]